ncbi:MAG: GNAT family N-acetyltransferase, partial [Pseudomonadota bacterium]
DAAEDWAFARGMPKVQLMVRADNEPIASFYRSIGYEDNPSVVLNKWRDPENRASKRPRLNVTVTYLELSSTVIRSKPPHPAEALAFLRVRQPDVGYYRFLYQRIGAPWCWYARTLMSDTELSSLLADSNREVYVLFGDGAPAGLAELERQINHVELSYFGLDREWIGRGVGRHLMAATLDAAFAFGAPRVTTNTCTLDHPRALAFYQRCGFTPVGQSNIDIDDPRAIGAAPADASPHLAKSF